jgi:hypothetical protein
MVTLMVIQILPFNVMRIRNTCICQPHIHLDPEPVYHFYVDLDPTFPCCADPCGSSLGSATRVSNVITKLWIPICIRIDLHYLSRWNRIQIRIQKADRDPDLGGQNWPT